MHHGEKNIRDTSSMLGCSLHRMILHQNKNKNKNQNHI
jgi:hypothetical protein